MATIYVAEAAFGVVRGYWQDAPNDAPEKRVAKGDRLRAQHGEECADCDEPGRAKCRPVAERAQFRPRSADQRHEGVAVRHEHQTDRDPASALAAGSAVPA
jgi:hypothetical protein